MSEAEYGSRNNPLTTNLIQSIDFEVIWIF